MKKILGLLIAMVGMAGESLADTITIRYRGVDKGDTPPMYVTLVQAKDSKLYPGMKVKGVVDANVYAKRYTLGFNQGIEIPRPNLVYSDRKVDTYVVASNDYTLLDSMVKSGNLPAQDLAQGLVVKKIGQVVNKSLYFYYESGKLFLYTSLRDLNRRKKASPTTYTEGDWNIITNDGVSLKRSEALQVMPAAKPSKEWSEIEKELKAWEREIAKRKKDDPMTAQDFFDAWSGHLSTTSVTATVQEGQVVFSPEPPASVSKLLASINKKFKKLPS